MDDGLAEFFKTLPNLNGIPLGLQLGPAPAGNFWQPGSAWGLAGAGTGSGIVAHAAGTATVVLGSTSCRQQHQRQQQLATAAAGVARLETVQRAPTDQAMHEVFMTGEWGGIGLGFHDLPSEGEEGRKK